MTWSSLDLTSHCLFDERRTTAFVDTIRSCVQPSDSVIDLGAGSGVLCAIARELTQNKVVAVENDPIVCKFLVGAFAAAKLDISVVQCDAKDYRDSAFDVAVIEMIDTWLLEEEYSNVVTELLKYGVINNYTKVIPHGYTFSIEFGWSNFESMATGYPWPYYQWPYYSNSNWRFPSFQPRLEYPEFTQRTGLELAQPFGSLISFTKSLNKEESVALSQCNATRLSGKILLDASEQFRIDVTNALNAPLILPIRPHAISDSFSQIEVTVDLNRGLSSLAIQADSSDDEHYSFL